MGDLLCTTTVVHDTHTALLQFPTLDGESSTCTQAFSPHTCGFIWGNYSFPTDNYYIILFLHTSIHQSVVCMHNNNYRINVCTCRHTQYGAMHVRVCSVYNYAEYSRTSIIRTPLCHLHCKSVQISEFVRISESHSVIYKVVINYSNRTHYSNRTYTWSQNTLIEQSVVLFG